MAKYYVTCGSCSLLTSASDARSASLWALHRFLAGRVDLDHLAVSAARSLERADVNDALMALDETVCISETGFGRDDAGRLNTAALLGEWHQLLVAVQRLKLVVNGQR
jgi:hypothetical protein